jgi:hypothetical protein
MLACVLVAVLASRQGAWAKGTTLTIKLERRVPGRSTPQPASANDGSSVKLVNYLDAQVRLSGAACARVRCCGVVQGARGRRARCGAPLVWPGCRARAVQELSAQACAGGAWAGLAVARL